MGRVDINKQQGDPAARRQYVVNVSLRHSFPSLIRIMTSAVPRSSNPMQDSAFSEKHRLC
ncbi:hypothetical protein [Synechococcus sp. MIT S1220]|uniref:hypothetical protein n=1 Tax=Synechococcus sp. MIT S1220 TaxID=3082549 RepID=UPI0039AF5112